MSSAPALAQDEVGPATGTRLPAPPKLDVEGDARREALDETIPLRDRRAIRQFKETYLDTKAAAAEPIGPVPDPINRPVSISLEPGSKAVRVNVYPERLTTMTFYDASGAPWPVATVVGGNGKHVKVTRPEEGSNAIDISPLTYTPKTNATVRLTKLATPITLDIHLATEACPRLKAKPATKKGHEEAAEPSCTYDAQIHGLVQAMSENANPQPVSMATGVPVTGSADLMSFLAGIAPRGAEVLQVTGGQAQAWRFGNMTYLRSSLRVLSPAYSDAAHGPGGMHVYSFPVSSTDDETGVPIILAFDDTDRPVQLELRSIPQWSDVVAANRRNRSADRE